MKPLNQNKMEHKLEIKTVKCPNQHCDDGVVDIIFGEKQFCGICDGEGLIDDVKQETIKSE